MTLPTAILDRLLERLNDENTLGVALAGSFARGEAGRYSDVDLWHYVKQETAQALQAPPLQLIDGYLVSIKAVLLEKEYADLQNPRRAIWAVLPMRSAKVLLDRDGRVGALFETARNFRWKPLQPEADRFASRRLAGTAEEVYKILDGLSKKAESKVLYAIWSLTQDMADALVVQRGILIPTENKFIELVQQFAGMDSAWTRSFRLAVGLDTCPPEEPPYRHYGKAGLQLYRETICLLEGVLTPEDRRVVDHALQVITEAGIV